MSSLKLVISGAAPLGPELEKELARRLKTSVTQAYGLTESVGGFFSSSPFSKLI